MGRAIDTLSAKLVAQQSLVELAQVAGSMSNPDSAARPAPFKPKPKPKAKTAAKPVQSTRQGVDNAYRKADPGDDDKDKGGGSDSDFEKMHPRDKATGRFVYKEDTGKGAAGLGTKDKGLPSGKPDGQVHGRVSEAQQALVKAGFLKETDGHQGQAVDGFLGRYTESALRRYQQDKGLKVTGDIDEATAKALGLKETGGAPAKKATSKEDPYPTVGSGDPMETALSLLRELLKKQRTDVKLTDEDNDLIALAVKKGSLDWSPKKNWVDQEGGLPTFIENMAIHMMENSGLTREHAIRASIVRTKVLAAKGNRRAVEALAKWEAMKAKAHARPNKD